MYWAHWHYAVPPYAALKALTQEQLQMAVKNWVRRCRELGPNGYDGLHPERWARIRLWVLLLWKYKKIYIHPTQRDWTSEEYRAVLIGKWLE